VGRWLYNDKTLFLKYRGTGTSRQAVGQRETWDSQNDADNNFRLLS
jgi:hypothetical protein